MYYVYAVYKNSDMAEGRGPSVLDCLIGDEDEAAKYIDHRPGVMGRTEKWSNHNYGDWHYKKCPVYSSAAEVEVENNKAIKEQAISKLTREEKKALGLEKSDEK